MRARFLLGSVTLAVCVFSPSLFGNREKIHSELNVRQKVESEIDNLKKNLKAAKTPEEKFRFLSKSEVQIEDLRKKNALQADPDEIYMDLLTASLKRIPRGKDFKSAQCHDYQTSIQARFNPRQEDSPEPAIAQTMQVLDLLCQ